MILSLLLACRPGVELSTGIWSDFQTIAYLGDASYGGAVEGAFSARVYAW